MLVWRLGSVKPEREEQAGRGEAACFFFAEVALVEIKRRFAVEFEEHIADGARDAPARTELVPTAGAAVSDADGGAIEADRGDKMIARRTIGTDQRGEKIRTVTRETAGKRNLVTDDRRNSGDQLAAVDVKAIG